MDLYERETNGGSSENNDPGVMSSDEDEGVKKRADGGGAQLYRRVVSWKSEPNNLGPFPNLTHFNPNKTAQKPACNNNGNTNNNNKKFNKISIYKLLEIVCSYTESLRANPNALGAEKHPIKAVSHIMKLSAEETHRKTICELNGIQAITALIETEHSVHGSTSNETHCILLRKFACMAVSNLAFNNNSNNHRISLCLFREFMRALVVQLRTPNDELRQVTASILKNLTHRADSSSKDILREVGSVTALMKAAIAEPNHQTTLKLILASVLHLSNHSTKNKSEICAVENALAFLVETLASPTPELAELSGGILNNISSQIAARYDYREILQQHGCLDVLLEHLKSPSLVIVTNACGTLFNLSTKRSGEQEALKKMGAQQLLQDLTHSKHKVIAMGASAVLKNLILTAGNVSNVSSNSASSGILKASRYAVQSSPINYSLRNKYSDCVYEDDCGEIPEQPIDYSQKYDPQPLDYALKYGEAFGGEFCAVKTAPLKPPPGAGGLPNSNNKSVKFVVEEALETPLMFSRSSSLASLESVSYHDDKSSVVSEFSRLASGIVSPSEIPDSPFQTSPKGGGVNGSNNPRLSSQKMGLPLTETLQKPSVFEDEARRYECEGTPDTRSARSSLSELTFASESEPSEDDKDILAACIDSGMKSCQKAAYDGDKVVTFCTEDTPAALSRAASGGDLCEKPCGGDSVRAYCTEDTPALLSHACSNSNLSDLSKLSDPEIGEEAAAAPPKGVKALARIFDRPRAPPNVGGGGGNNTKRSVSEKVNGFEQRSALSGAASSVSLASLESLSAPPPDVGGGGGNDGNHTKRSVSEKVNTFEQRNVLSGAVSSVSLASLESLSTPPPNVGGGGGSDGNHTKRSVSEKVNTFEQRGALSGAVSSVSLASLESLEDTEEDLALLQECISLGMQKRTLSVDCAHAQSDKDLLQNCITSAMPKSKPPKSAPKTSKKTAPEPPKYCNNTNLVRNSAHRQSLPLFNCNNNNNKRGWVFENNRAAPVRRSMDNLKAKKDERTSPPPPLPPRPPKPGQETRPKSQNIASKFNLQSLKQSIKTVAKAVNNNNNNKQPLSPYYCSKIPHTNNYSVGNSSDSERVRLRPGRSPSADGRLVGARAPSDGCSSSCGSLNGDGGGFRRSFRSAIPSPLRSLSNASLGAHARNLAACRQK